MILFIDTVSPAPKILLIGNNIHSSIEIPINNDTQISESLIAKLSKTFQNDFDIKKTKKIIVCRGPGSFTALRVGMGVAIGFKSILNVSLYGLTAFEILLHHSRVNYKYENVYAVIGSTNNQIFYGAFNIKNEFIIKPQKFFGINELKNIIKNSMLISNIKINGNYSSNFSFVVSIDICKAISSFNLNKLQKEQDILRPFYIST